jgi:hypothetical protein
MTPSMMAFNSDAMCHYADCRLCCFTILYILLSVVMLIVDMLNIIMLNVVC